jgi:long-chain acyl-CoA synthetase
LNMLDDRIKFNDRLRIIDEVSGQYFAYEDLPGNPLTTIERTLVFCYLNNSIESVSFLIKALESQHVLVLLSSTLPEKLKSILESTYSPNFIYDLSRSEIGDYNLSGTMVHSRRIVFSHKLHENLRVLLSTSGTTGSPKFVKLSTRNLLANAESISSYLPILESDRVPLNLPIHYSYGLSILTSNAVKGATLIAGVQDVISKGFWENFQKYQYSTFAGVPFVYEMLGRIGFTKMKLSSLRYFTQAGGKLRDELIIKYGEFAREQGKLFYVMYGQTEATARMSFLHPNELLSHVGSIGKPIPGGRFELNKVTSELQFVGPNVFGGYAECIGDLSTFVSPVILNTGDLAKVDEQGFYYITGRSKRFVKIFGNRINLDELESALSNRFGAFYPCVGWHDKAVWVFSTNSKEDESQILQWLSVEFKLHPSSFKLKIIDTVPLTANGKLDYKSLLSDYENT